MLVLRRKVGERIIVDDQIEVTVLAIRNGKVRLGFSAPHAVRILREEAGRKKSPALADGRAASRKAPALPKTRELALGR